MSAKRRTIILKVHRRDILSGVRADCWACPIAIVATRLAIDSVHVYVSGFTDGAGRGIGRLPYDARQWQRRFDRGDKVEPIRFKMRVPADYFPPRKRVQR
jgi:hypothetical protein